MGIMFKIPIDQIVARFNSATDKMVAIGELLKANGYDPDKLGLRNELKKVLSDKGCENVPGKERICKYCRKPFVMKKDNPSQVYCCAECWEASKGNKDINGRDIRHFSFNDFVKVENTGAGSDRNYTDLANAIVMQAVEDMCDTFTSSVDHREKYVNREPHLRKLTYEFSRFKRGDYSWLTEADPDMLVESIVYRISTEAGKTTIRRMTAMLRDAHKRGDIEAEREILDDLKSLCKDGEKYIDCIEYLAKIKEWSETGIKSKERNNIVADTTATLGERYAHSRKWFGLAKELAGIPINSSKYPKERKEN